MLEVLEKLTQEDLLNISRVYFKDNSILVYYDYCEWMLNNAKKDRDNVVNKNLVYLFDTYNNIVNKLENEFNKIKSEMLLYCMFLIDKGDIKIKFVSEEK